MKVYLFVCVVINSVFFEKGNNFQISKNKNNVLRYNENKKLIDFYIEKEVFEVWKNIIWFNFFY